MGRRYRPGREKETPLRDGRGRDSRQRVGSDVYRYFLSRIWWAYPLYLLSITPGMRNVFDYAYRHFADNRYWISRTCHMPIAPMWLTASGLNPLSIIATYTRSCGSPARFNSSL